MGESLWTQGQLGLYNEFLSQNSKKGEWHLSMTPEVNLCPIHTFLHMCIYTHIHTRIHTYPKIIHTSKKAIYSLQFLSICYVPSILLDARNKTIMFLYSNSSQLNRESQCENLLGEPWSNPKAKSKPELFSWQMRKNLEIWLWCHSFFPSCMWIKLGTSGKTVALLS